MEQGSDEDPDGGLLPARSEASAGLHPGYADLVGEVNWHHPDVDLTPQLIQSREHTAVERAQFIADAYAELTADPDDGRWFRQLVFWRTTRFLAVFRGLAARDEQLSEALQHENIFETRHKFVHSTFNVLSTNLALHLQSPVTPIHPHHALDGELLHLQVSHLAVAAALGVSAGTKKYPQAGLQALRYMRGRSDHFRRLFPSIEEVLRFELNVIQRTSKWLALRPRAVVSGQLTSVYGLSPREATDMLRMADSYSQRLHAASVDEKQAHMVGHLEDVVARAKKALDLNNEIKALRLLSTVQGLGGPVDQKTGQGLVRLLQANPLEDKLLPDVLHDDTASDTADADTDAGE